MNRRLVFIAFIAIAVLLLLGVFVQVQRPGTARVIRSGGGVRAVRSVVGFAPRLTRSCTTQKAGDFLRFNDSVVVTDAHERQFPAQIRFDYLPPASTPEQWPDGDWCSSLSQRVGEVAAQWTGAAPGDLLITDRRKANGAAGDALQKELERQGFQVRNLTVRFIVPDMMAGARIIPAIEGKASRARPVIFVGLDGADWTLLEGYMNEGRMPNLSALVREGRRGILKTQHPPLSPLLWNTMMTGVSPLEHRILDFTRFHPQSRTKEPITADERRAPAIWNMATQGGKSVAVFGLWGTYPAEPVRGLLVSDRFFTFLIVEDSPPPGVVFPPSREGWARTLRANADKNVGYERVRQYLPWLTESEFESRAVSRNPYEHPVSALQRILVETDAYHALARDYLSAHDPDLTIVYFQGTDSVGHVFAPYNPPRQPEISEEDFVRYQNAARRYFQEMDRILGDYRDLAQKKNAVLMLASDHGFRWHEGRPAQLSSFAATTAAKWHRDEGIYLLWGPGIQAGRGPQGTIDQVAATLLDLAGLPPGEGLAGPSLTTAATRGQRVNYREHFRPIAPASPAPPEQASEEIAKLRALGYIGATESNTAPEGSTRTAGSHNNEALILRNQGREKEAISAFESAIKVDPDLASAAWNLSDLLHRRNAELDRSDDLLVRAFANGLPEGIKYVVGRAIGYQRAGQAQRSLDLLEKAVAANPSDPELRLFRGRYRIDRGDCGRALEDFRVAQQLTPRNPIAFASAGIAEVCLGNQAAAAAHFRRSLEIDPDQPRIRAYLQSLQ